MEYKFDEKRLRGICSSIINFELEVLLLKRLIEDLEFKILGTAKEQEDKENGAL